MTDIVSPYEKCTLKARSHFTLFTRSNKILTVPSGRLNYPSIESVSLSLSVTLSHSLDNGLTIAAMAEHFIL